MTGRKSLLAVLQTTKTDIFKTSFSRILFDIFSTFQIFLPAFKSGDKTEPGVPPLTASSFGLLVLVVGVIGGM